VAETLSQALRDLAASRGDEPALIGAELTYSWAALDDAVDRAAVVLKDEGVRQGQLVGLVIPRTPALAISFLAIVRLGAVVVPINHKLKTKWIEAQLEGLSAVVVDPALPHQALFEVPPISSVSLLEAPAAADMTEWPADADTVCYLNCTSGSTGRPKRAITTHGQIMANARATVQVSGQGAGDVFWCLFASFAHPHECFHRCLVSGAAFVMVDTMSPRVVSRLVTRHGVSHMLLLPGFAELWLDAGISPESQTTLRLVEAGGSIVTPDLHARMSAAIRGSFLAVWGSTETSGVALSSSGNGGSILPGYCIRVVDEGGRSVGSGDIGELCLSGPAVVSGYSAEPTGGSTPFIDGWFHTGDLVRQDEAGRVHFLGRKSNLLKVSGARVFPAEIEQVLLEHPSVREVIVVGLPDRRRGEVPVAVVVGTDDHATSPSALKAHCRERLAVYKVPRRIDCWDVLPRLPSGKVDRQAVLDRLS